MSEQLYIDHITTHKHILCTYYVYNYVAIYTYLIIYVYFLLPTIGEALVLVSVE